MTTALKLTRIHPQCQDAPYGGTMTDTDQDNRPTWTWTNDMGRPSSIHVEPSFRSELGLVFVGIGERDAATGAWKADRPEGRSNHGIWLDKPTVLAFIRALDDAAEWSENYDPDAEPEGVGRS